jgi:putative ABC transport system substrate-binding protein
LACGRGFLKEGERFSSRPSALPSKHSEKKMKPRFPYLFVCAAVLLTASGWPGDSRAQAKIAHVGILTVAVADDAGEGRWLVPFRRKLAEQGWIEGRDVSFEYRNASGDPARFAGPPAPTVRAAYSVTRTTPIVAQDFTSDPLAEGYVESYGRPGRNATGVFLDAPEFSAKWLELLRAMIPGLSRIAVLCDPSAGPAHLRALQAIAPSFGLQL